MGISPYHHLIVYSRQVKTERITSWAIASGFPVLENNNSRAASIESILHTFSILQINVSEDFRVSSVSSPICPSYSESHGAL